MMDSLPETREEMAEEHIICDPCRADQECNAGVTFCLDCKEALCKLCTKCHKNFKVSKDHILIDIEAVAAGTRRSDILTCVGMCTIHPEKELDIHCKSHDTVVCSLCSTSQHSDCDATEILTHDFELSQLRKDSKALMSQMQETKGHLERLQTLKEEAGCKFTEKLYTIREYIKQVRHQLVELMDQVVNHVLDVTKRMELERNTRIDAGMVKVTKLTELTGQKLTLLDAIANRGSERHAFVSTHLMRKQLEDNTRQLCEEEKLFKTNVPKLVITENLKMLIERTGAENLVHVEVTESDDSNMSYVGVSTSASDSDTVSKRTQTIETDSEDNHKSLTSETTSPKDTCVASKPADTNENKAICGSQPVECALTSVKDKSDASKRAQIEIAGKTSSSCPSESVSAIEEDADVVENVLRNSKLIKTAEHTVCPEIETVPWYNGVAVHEDGRVILNDFNRRYLCLYNPADRTILKLKMKHRPFSAVELDGTHIAVSNSNHNSISMVTYDNELKIEKTLSTKNNLRTIVALKNGQLAVAWSDPPVFGVIDISGTEIVQRSYLDQDTNGRKFKSFEYMAVDEERQHVIQSCSHDKAVYCFNFKGHAVFMYDRLQNPHGVALDKCGNIYICENKSPGSIHKLSPTGDPISVITEGVPAYPLAICSDVNSAGFWVTRYSSRANVVYFRLEQRTQI